MTDKLTQHAGGRPQRIKTACVMPSTARVAYFGSRNALDLDKALTLAEHLATIGKLAVDGADAPLEVPFVTRWVDATYGDGSIGGVWISETVR